MIRLYLTCTWGLRSIQCLKQHHHRNANQSSAAAPLTKNKWKIKIYTHFFLVVMSLFHVHPLPPMSLFVTTFGYPPPPTQWLQFWKAPKMFNMIFACPLINATWHYIKVTVKHLIPFLVAVRSVHDWIFGGWFRKEKNSR